MQNQSRALCGITMCILKNYQCMNPPSPRRPIASNQSNLTAQIVDKLKIQLEGG